MAVDDLRRRNITHAGTRQDGSDAGVAKDDMHQAVAGGWDKEQTQVDRDEAKGIAPEGTQSQGSRPSKPQGREGLGS